MGRFVSVIFLPALQARTPASRVVEGVISAGVECHFDNPYLRSSDHGRTWAVKTLAVSTFINLSQITPMPLNQNFASVVLAAGASAFFLAPALSAQSGGQLPPGTTVSSVDTTFIQQFNTDLDAGGDFSVSSIGARYNLFHSLGEGKSLGGSFGYRADSFDFGGAGGLGKADPWDTIHSLSLTGLYGTPLGGDWDLRLAPSLTLAGESSAAISDSLIYGGVFTFSRTFSESLTLGIGAGVFSELEEINGFPILAVRWEFAPGWTLQNPLRPGPTGPAGLEVSYKVDDWDLGIGAAYRSYRFRLADDAPVSGGIGEYTSNPLFLRASRSINRSFSFDVYGGVLLGGSLKVDDSGGGGLVDSDFEAAPFAAISLTGRF